MKTKKPINSLRKPKEEAISPQVKLGQGRLAMQNALVERNPEIDLALTALIAQQHILLVGPPGTAKSLVVETIRSWITGAKSLVVHCCKDTQRSQTFGPVKLSSLQQDKMERVLQGGAADVEILVLEEVFKSGPAVLDTFLLLMNERIYKEGLVQAKAPLKLLMGVSNEWSPEGCEAALAAFFDRFLFRKAVKPVSKTGRREILRRAMTLNNCKAKFPEPLTLAEVEQAHNEAMILPLQDQCKRDLWKILEELSKEGIEPGDRRIYQSLSAIRSYAYLLGAQEVATEHLEILAHVLWQDPLEQAQKAGRIIAKISNPTGARINELLLQAEEILEKSTPVDCVPKLQQIQKELGELPENTRKGQALKEVGEYIKTAYNKVIGAQS